MMMMTALVLLAAAAILPTTTALIQLQGEDEWSPVEVEEERLIERLVLQHRSAELPAHQQDPTSRYRDDFPMGDADPYETTWKEQRLQELLRLLSAKKLENVNSGSVPGLGGAGGATGGIVPPPRHRPYKPFAYSIIDHPDTAPSSFAVPPSDERFYQTQNALFGDESKVLSVVDKGNNDDISLEESTTWRTSSSELGQEQENPALPEYPMDELSSPQVFKTPLIDFNATKEDIIFVAVVAGSSAAVVVGVALLGYGWYRLHKSSKAAADVDYPAYGVTGPTCGPTGPGAPNTGGTASAGSPASAADRRLAHSAQMYHYQLTKQQIIAMESNRGGGGERRGSLSEADSDDENEEGDYTVYECPGLAPTGEMEVKNPLFDDEPTPGLNGSDATGGGGTQGRADLMAPTLKLGGASSAGPAPITIPPSTTSQQHK